MLMTTIIAAALAAQATPDSHASHAAPPAPQTTPLDADESAVGAVLSRYKSAIERLDATGTEALFTEDSAVLETVGIEGDLATETYDYRIETKTGEIATHKGVATSVLARNADGWKILIMHNSARKPKGA